MLVYVKGQFFNGRDIEFETLEAAKLNRIDLVYFIALTLRNKATTGTSPAEMASWPLKLAEANAGGGSLLALEAQYRGISEAALVAKILASAAQLSALEAQIAGVSGLHADAIEALTTIEEVRSYNMISGWPEV